MSIPPEIDNCIKESIDHFLGLPISTQTLESKLISSQSQCLSLQSKLNSAKEEAKLNAQGLKKAIEKNQILSEENSRLVEQFKKLKTFINKGKSALDRVKETQIRIHELENEVEKLKLDLNFFKDQHGQMQKFQFSFVEEVLVESALSELIGKTDSSVCELFLSSNIENESCRRLLHLSRSLGPPTLRALSMAATIKTLEKDNQQLQRRLSTTQGEVKLLSDQIGYLMEEQTASYNNINGGGVRKPPAGSSSVKVPEKKRPSLED